MRFGILPFLLLALPLIDVVWVSFSPTIFLERPQGEWSLRWYRAFFADARWLLAIRNSILVASGTTLLALVLVLMMGVANRWGRLLLILPATLPPAVIGLGTWALLRGVGLGGSFLGLILVHTVLVLPIVYLIIDRARSPEWHELHRVARGLGGSPGQVFRHVTLPLLYPALRLAAIAAWVLSFHEAMASIFLVGPRTETLPAVMWPQLRFHASPLLAVAACASVICGLLAWGLNLGSLPFRTGSADREESQAVGTTS